MMLFSFSLPSTTQLIQRTRTTHLIHRTRYPFPLSPVICPIETRFSSNISSAYHTTTPLQITAWNRSALYCQIFPTRLSTHSVRVLHRPAPNLQFLLPSHLVSFILFHASICHLFSLRRCLLILPPYQRMSEVPSDSERISALQTRRVAFYEEVSRRIDLMGTNTGILMDTTYDEIVEFINAIKECATNDERRQIMRDNAARNPYRLLEKYDLIVNSDSTRILIFKQKGGSALDSCQIVVKFSSIFDVVRQIHEVEAGNDHPKSKTLHKHQRPFINVYLQNMGKASLAGYVSCSQTFVQFVFVPDTAVNQRRATSLF
jgi:hypothetical protein